MKEMTYDELRAVFPKAETGNAKMISDVTHELITIYEELGLSPDDALERISKVWKNGVPHPPNPNENNEHGNNNEAAI